MHGQRESQTVPGGGGLGWGERCTAGAPGGRELVKAGFEGKRRELMKNRECRDRPADVGMREGKQSGDKGTSSPL